MSLLSNVLVTKLFSISNTIEDKSLHFSSLHNIHISIFKELILWGQPLLIWPRPFSHFLKFTNWKLTKIKIWNFRQSSSSSSSGLDSSWLFIIQCFDCCTLRPSPGISCIQSFKLYSTATFSAR